MADDPILNSIADQIALNESGGGKGDYDPYSVVGRQTPKGDKPYGKYQIMGANIPSWTTDALGAPLTPEAFLANPDAQEQTARHRIEKYFTQFGNARDVASLWHSGVPYDRAVAENRRDTVFGNSTKDYADKIAAAVDNGNPASPNAPAADTSVLPSVPSTGREQPDIAPAAPDVKIRLPDSTVINLGPNPSADVRAQVKQKIAEKFPQLAQGGQPLQTPTSTTTTPSSTDAPPPAAPPKSIRDQTVNDAAKVYNNAVGMADDHWVGKYTAAFGKPVADALVDVYDNVKDLLTHTDARSMTQNNLQTILTTLRPLAVPAEIASNVVKQAATDAGMPPHTAAALGMAASVIAGAETPIPGGGLGPAAEMPLQGTAAARAAVGDAESAAGRSAQWTQAAERVAGEGKQQAGVADAAATAAAQRADAAATATQLSPAVKTAAEAALAPGGATTEQAGQAAAAGLASDLSAVKDPVQGIYKGVAENAANAAKGVDPGQYKSIFEGITAIEDELGSTLTGQPKEILASLKDRIGKGEKLTFADLDAYKQQLDTLFPGKQPLGATPRTAQLYNFKWDVRRMMSGMLDGEDKDWFDTANAMWRDQVIPKQKLLDLVKKTDPGVVVERLFGNGTTDKQAAMAKRVMASIGDDPAGSGELIRQAFAKRLISKATAGGETAPTKLLKAYDALNGGVQDAMFPPGARTFFETLRQQQGAAATAASDAAAAIETAKGAAGQAKALESIAGKAAKTHEGATAAVTAAKAAATAPNTLARLTARGLEFAAGEGVAKLLGVNPLAGGVATLVLPSDTLATALANSKTANILARALKTPVNSAVVPAMLQQLKKFGVNLMPMPEDKP